MHNKVGMNAHGDMKYKDAHDSKNADYVNHRTPGFLDGDLKPKSDLSFRNYQFSSTQSPKTR